MRADSRLRRNWRKGLWRVAIAGLPAALLFGQTTPQNPTGEMSVQDESVTFRSRVNLVMVPVVVRDRKGVATGDLHQEDFVLTDSGKPQSITRFSVEKGNTVRSTPAQRKDLETTAEDPTAPPVVVAEHYSIYVFDDVHASFGDLAHVRDAALNHLNASLKPTDRAAVFTTSGQGMEDFTDDKQKLQTALMRLRPRPLARSTVQECPDMTYYIADLIVNHNDQDAKYAMVVQAMNCLGLDPKTNPDAAQIATSAVDASSRQYIVSGEHETRVSLSVIRDAIRRLSVVPGQRTILLASPGILITTTNQFEKMELIDRAIRANVVINTLDARGLYTDVTFEASRSGVGRGDTKGLEAYYRDSAHAEADILAELSYGTGGTFFQNNNDFDQAFRLLAGAPEYIYMLGFSPQNLKVDGKFHSLKVTLKNSKGVTLQARRGYFAPKVTASPEQTAKQELEEALFSREEMQDIPLQFHTQFFKKDEFNAKLSVLNRVDVRQLHFRKGDGRNYDVLTIVTALFDRNGTLVNAVKQTVEMRLLDETLTKKLAPGIALRSGFDVQTGTYAVRVVVRDSEGQLMSAANGSVNIP